MNGLHDEAVFGPDEAVPAGLDHQDRQGLTYRPLDTLSEQGIVHWMDSVLQDETDGVSIETSTLMQLFKLTEPQVGWVKKHINDNLSHGKFADLLEEQGQQGLLDRWGGNPTP
jgi:hypothetical protein